MPMRAKRRTAKIYVVSRLESPKKEWKGRSRVQAVNNDSTTVYSMMKR
jgi:hypothetical protein